MVLIIEYDGSRYHGSQYQDNAPTIQGEMEHALEKLTQEKMRVAAASRTDAGVHAKGQVISFKTDAVFPAETWIRALNHYLPRDIAIKAAYNVDNGFDVRRDAWSREYRYSILNIPAPSPLMRKFTYFMPHSLDIEAMDGACQVLVGEHDFASFTTVVNGGARRKVHRAEIQREGDLVVFDMEANSFLPHQVRNTAGALIRVGLRKMNVETFCELAWSGQAGAIGPTAPAQGLCLTNVNYRNFAPLAEEMLQ